MHARVNTFQGSPDGVEASVENVRQQVLPAARQLEGFRGLISLADRATGREIGITLWESEEAMRASEEAGSRLRKETADAGGEEIVSVERFEVTLFELEE